MRGNAHHDAERLQESVIRRWHLNPSMVLVGRVEDLDDLHRNKQHCASTAPFIDVHFVALRGNGLASTKGQ